MMPHETVQDKLATMQAVSIKIVALFNKRGNYHAAQQFQTLLHHIDNARTQIDGMDVGSVEVPK